jgi:acyl carrier protein
MPLADELIAAIESWEINLPPLTQHTSLIRSGLFDSVILLNLVLWVEEKAGTPIDPTGFDLVEEWDTVADIVKFVGERRNAAAPR